MNLRAQELAELNSLLSDNLLDLPKFRRAVDRRGTNYQWLQKHIQTRNPNLHPRLHQLLSLRHKPNESKEQEEPGTDIS